MLADIRRGLSSTVLLELAPGASYSQTTHTMLLRGQLLAAAAAPEGLRPAAAGEGREGDLGGMPRKAPPSAAYDFDGPPTAGGGGHGLSSGGAEAADGEWEATLAASVASAAAPKAPRILPWLWCSRYRCNQAAAVGSSAGGGGGIKLAEQLMWQAGREGALLLVCLTEGGEVPQGLLDAEDAAELAAIEAAAAADAAAAAAAPPPLSPGALRSHPLGHGSGEQLAGGAAGGRTEEGGAAARALARITSQLPPRASGLM